jgi:RNA polymerase sigma factor (sigma-70 family)
MSLAQAVPNRFEDLFAREYPRVVSVAYRITRDSADAEDVAQEVFAQFVRMRRASDANAPAWLHVAAIHVALNGLRSQRRRRDREGRAAQPGGALHSTAGAANPEQLIEQNFDRECVRRALVRLAQKDAEILALRYGGLSYREIADAMHIDAAQIGTRLARAERAFRRELEHERI